MASKEYQARSRRNLSSAQLGVIRSYTVSHSFLTLQLHCAHSTSRLLFSNKGRGEKKDLQCSNNTLPNAHYKKEALAPSPADPLPPNTYILYE